MFQRARRMKRLTILSNLQWPTFSSAGWFLGTRIASTTSVLAIVTEKGAERVQWQAQLPGRKYFPALTRPPSTDLAKTPRLAHSLCRSDRACTIASGTWPPNARPERCFLLSARVRGCDGAPPPES